MNRTAKLTFDQSLVIIKAMNLSGTCELRPDNALGNENLAVVARRGYAN